MIIKRIAYRDIDIKSNQIQISQTQARQEFINEHISDLAHSI